MPRGALAALSLLALLAGAVADNTNQQTALSVAQCNCGKAFVELLLKYGYGDALSASFTGTLFALTDEAMARLPSYVPDRVRDMISYHIVPGVSGPLSYLIDQSPLATLYQPNTLKAYCTPDAIVGCMNTVSIIGSPIAVNKASPTGATVVCIAEGLVPCPAPPPSSPCVQQTASYSPQCSPVTIPRHPLPSPKCPQVIQWNPPKCGSPSYSYVPAYNCPSPPPCAVPKGEVAISIWNIIVTDPRFTILAQLLEDCGLSQRVATMSKSTFFAPSNEAIANTLLWLGIQDYQLFDSTPLVKAILAYHIVPGAMIWADEIECGTPHVVTMLQESELTLHGGMKCKGTYTKEDGDAFVVEADRTVANVVQSDIQGTMVLVHAIDFMLLPAIPELDVLFTGQQHK